MNLPVSTNILLLVAGIAILAVNIVFSLFRLWRGHVHAGILNVVLVLGACVLIAVGLVRITFPFLAGTIPARPAAVAVEPTNPAPSNQTVSGDNGSPSDNSARARRRPTGATAEATDPVAVAQVTAGDNNGVATAAATPGRTRGTGFGGQGGNPAAGNQSKSGTSGGNFGGNTSGSGNPQSGGTNQFAILATERSFIPVLAIAGIAAALIGLVLFGEERHRQGFNPSSSPGLLYAGAGVFVLAAALIVPTLPGQFSSGGQNGTGAARFSASAAVRARAGLPTATPTIAPTPTATATALPTLTPAPSESATPLVTAIAYAGAPTDVSTVTNCTLTAQTTINLRGDPSVNQQAIGRVFAGSLLSATGRTADKKWWRVINNDGNSPVEGWVSNDYVTAGPNCDAVPLAGPTPTPSRTPRVTATSAPTATTPAAATPAATGNAAADTTGASCTVITTTSVSLRGDPSRLHPPLAQVPEKTSLVATGKSADGFWYQVTYTADGKTTVGWVGGGALMVPSACAALPVANPAM